MHYAESNCSYADSHCKKVYGGMFTVKAGGYESNDNGSQKKPEKKHNSSRKRSDQTGTPTLQGPSTALLMDRF